MLQKSSIIQYLDSLLQPASYHDWCLNGLQVDAGNQQLSKIAVAVDSGLSVIEEAIKQEADLLIVHHGLFWRDPVRLVGPLGEKIRSLISGRCSLYASHLPLDGNREVGNAFELGRFLELSNLESFFEVEGSPIGACARTVSPQPLEYFKETLKNLPGATDQLVLDFGPEKVKSLGIVTGSGSEAISAAAEAGFDLLITGEAKQMAYHLAKELGINVIFAGHYATETLGVIAIQKRLENDFDLETVFVSHPTGI